MFINKLKHILTQKRSCCETEVDKKQLRNLLKTGSILIDVRSPQEYEEGHLANAILIPHYEIKQKAETLLKNKSIDIIVYCSTGHRSKKAQKTLKKMGFEKVYNLCGGI